MDSNGIIIVKGFDWGPAVTKVVIKLGIDFDKTRNFDTTLFEVKEKRTNALGTTNTERKITDVYYSDESGNRIEGKGDYLSIEMAFGPDEGSPMYYDFPTGFNKWFDYEMVVRTIYGQQTNLNNEKFVFPEIKDIDLNDIKIQEDELTEVRWFSMDELKKNG